MKLHDQIKKILKSKFTLSNTNNKPKFKINILSLIKTGYKHFG